MKNYLSIILFMMLLSCESELSQLKKEREQLQIELNELQRKQQDQGIRFDRDIIEFQKQQEPILNRAKEINRRIDELEK